MLLHYLHEDLLTSKFNKAIAIKLAQLLCKWILCLPKRDGLAKVSYFWYYVNLHGVTQFQEEANAYFGSHIQDLKQSSGGVSILQAPILK